MSSVSDAGAFLDPEASRDYLRTWRADAERRAQRAAAMAAQMEQLRMSAKDGNNLAEVTVDSTGVLVDLVLTERIARVEPQVVARAVMSAMRQARAKAVEQAQQLAVDALGPDSVSARVIGERMRQALEVQDAAGDMSGRGLDAEPGHDRPGQDWLDQGWER